MKNLKNKLSVLAILLAAGCACTAFVVACSDDGGSSSGSAADSGGGDATTDSNTTTEGGQDAGPDRVVVEAGTLAEFLQLNPEATCARYKECCGGGFDVAKCVTDFKSSGWVQSLADLTADGVATGGKVVYDPAAGSECLTSIRNMTCKNTTSAEYKASLDKCFSAAKGSAAAGTACKSNAECVPTTFCDLTADAGAVCTALRTSGAVCGIREGSCSYRGAGSAGQCLDTDEDGTGNCQAPLANGTNCAQDFDCQSGGCNVADDGDGGVTAKCAANVDFLFGICEAYGGGDAGDGG